MKTADKAATVVAEFLNGNDVAANTITRRLADAGLLAPDLPAPAATSANDTPVWRAENTLMVTRYPDGEIAMLLGTGQEVRYTPETARAQAALLLLSLIHISEPTRRS